MEERLTKDEKKAIRQEEWREKLNAEKKKGFMKAIFAWSFGGLLLVLAIWALIAFSSNQSSSPNTPAIKAPALTSTDYQTGPTNAKVTLIEYADFQCPACKAYYPIIKQIQQDFNEKLLFVYRFFPLKTVHQNALNAAKAGYAAGQQGKFWEMHDKLFETQDSWATLVDPEATFVGFAKSLGINTDTFKKDYQDGKTDVLVSSDYDNATALGLNGTPSFFVNGKLISNPQSYRDFKKVITDALK